MTFVDVLSRDPEPRNAVRALCDDLTALYARGETPFTGSDPWTSTPPSRAEVPRLGLVARMFWRRVLPYRPPMRYTLFVLLLAACGSAPVTPSSDAATDAGTRLDGGNRCVAVGCRPGLLCYSDGIREATCVNPNIVDGGTWTPDGGMCRRLWCAPTSTCVNGASDPQNCGACGFTCPGVCANGYCVK